MIHQVYSLKAAKSQSSRQEKAPQSALMGTGEGATDKAQEAAKKNGGKSDTGLAGAETVTFSSAGLHIPTIAVGELKRVTSPQTIQLASV
jgi:hypothetical protein